MHLVFFISPRPPTPTLFPYTTLFRSVKQLASAPGATGAFAWTVLSRSLAYAARRIPEITDSPDSIVAIDNAMKWRSEEHTSELQSRRDLVCRLLLEKKKKIRAEYGGR